MGGAGIFDIFDGLLNTLGYGDGKEKGRLDQILEAAGVFNSALAASAIHGEAGGGIASGLKGPANKLIQKGYDEYVVAAVEQIDDMLGQIQGEHQKSPWKGGYGVRMDVYYEWQTCDCKATFLRDWMGWSAKKKKRYSCNFSKKNGSVSDHWLGADQKGREELTNLDIIKCFLFAEKQFRREICGSE